MTDNLENVDMSKVVKFYGSRGSYAVFSNFSLNPFWLNGYLWKTNEHYYQSQKYAGTEHEVKIRELKTPREAFYEGRDKKKTVRSDWEQVKEQVMYQGLKAKFTQHPALRQILLSTGNAYIVEDSPTDYFWGWGKDHSGKNRLGHLLMRLREELKTS